MITTNGADNQNPDNTTNSTTRAISEKTANDKVLEPKPVCTGEFSIRINNQYTSHSIIIFKLAGNMLQSTIISLRSTLNANKQQYTFLIFDMRDVRIISSAGWGFFIAEQKKLKEERRTLFLTDFQPDLQQVFESLQLHLMIQCFPILTDCLKCIYSEITVDSAAKSSEHYALIQNREIQEISNNDSSSCDLSNDPTECIHNAIVKYGPCSFFKLLSLLHSNEFNKLKIGPLKLRSLLKEMELDTFEKRLRYFRSW